MIKLNLQLPEGFFEEEVRCDHKVTKEMKEIWAVELDLLNELMRVCHKYDIKFFVDSGTVLGAVRHKGFIPWDDDIDVALLRDDYEKLCKVAPKEFTHPYFWQTEQTDPGVLRGHAQLRNSETTAILKVEYDSKLKFNQGVFLDVFPLDKIPEDVEEINKFNDKIKEYKEKCLDYSVFMPSRYTVPKSLYKRVLKSIVRPIGALIYRYYYNRFEKLLLSYNNSNSDLVSEVYFAHISHRTMWKSSWYSSSIYMDFEMLKVPLPVGYKEYLDTTYGNWKEFVKGASLHKGVIFDINKPYTEYIK